MKGWWKITVFHLKHSYLNWRVISCRRRTNCIYAIFFSTFFEFGFLDFLFELNRISQVHDMTINFFYFFSTTCLLRTTMHTIDGFIGWSTISQVGIVLKGSSFGQRVVHVISVQKKDYGSKVFHRNRQFPFWSTCSKTSIKDDFEILWSWLVFLVIGKELAGLKLL